MTQHYLDVSLLDPPEPLVQVMQAAHALRSGDYLHMHHRMWPRLLYRELEQHNFHHDTRQTADGFFEVFIWRADDCDAQQQAMQIARQLVPCQDEC